MSVYRFAGDWNNVATYAPNFVVVSNGLAYVAKETVTGGGEPPSNLAQWTYLPAGQQTAATFPIIEGDVSLSVNGTSDLVVTAGAADVKVGSSLLISGLLNNDVQDPPPTDGDVLKWNGSSSRIEWTTATSSTGFPVTSANGNINLEVSGSNFLISNSNAGGNISLSTEGNTYVQIGSQSSAIRLGDVNPSSPDLPSIVLNDAATTINGTNMANNVSIWNPVGATYIGSASNVNITNGSLLVDKLNNASNSPAPTSGQLLSWNGTKIEWANAVSNINLATGSVVIENPITSVISVTTDVPSSRITVGMAQGASGVYTEATGGSPNVTISITGMTSTGLVSLTYVHAGGGGGSQYLKTFTAGTNQVSLVYNTNVDVGDQIIWGVLKYATGGPS